MLQCSDTYSCFFSQLSLRIAVFFSLELELCHVIFSKDNIINGIDSYFTHATYYTSIEIVINNILLQKHNVNAAKKWKHLLPFIDLDYSLTISLPHLGHLVKLPLKYSNPHESQVSIISLGSTSSNSLSRYPSFCLKPRYA